LFCHENEQKGGKNGGSKSKGNGKHRYEADHKCVLVVIIALHLFCKNACFQNVFGCLEGKTPFRLMLIDQIIILFKRKNQTSKKKDNKKKAAEQVTLLFLSSKRQYCFVLNYLKFKFPAQQIITLSQGKETKNNFYATCTS